MNRQAITFLSLFSLILVLSVYYVMLPPVTSDNDQEIAITETDDEKNGQEEALQEKREDQIQKQEDVISSNTSSNEDVSEALEEIEKTKTMSQEEQTVKQALKDAGYENTFVEISAQTIKITVTKKEPTNEDAVAIMNIVLAKTSKKYTPEIKFVNE